MEVSAPRRFPLDNPSPQVGWLRAQTPGLPPPSSYLLVWGGYAFLVFAFSSVLNVCARRVRLGSSRSRSAYRSGPARPRPVRPRPSLPVTFNEDVTEASAPATDLSATAPPPSAIVLVPAVSLPAGQELFREQLYARCSRRSRLVPRQAQSARTKQRYAPSFPKYPGNWAYRSCRC